MSTYVICVMISRNFCLALTARCDLGKLTTINVLPDDVLIDIFDVHAIYENFYLNEKKKN